MKIVSIEVNDDVAKILADADIEGQFLRLSSQLNRHQYLEVDKVLKALGGKWDRKEKRHVFQENVLPKISAALHSGKVTDSKKTFCEFFTPPELAKFVVSRLTKDSGLALEPSAGDGSLLRALRGRSSTLVVHACEVQSKYWPRLEKEGAKIMAGDFLEYNPGPIYDIIVANPPFSGNDGPRHVSHMIDCLRDDGELLCVMSAGMEFRNDGIWGQTVAKLNATMSWNLESLGEGYFKDSGTIVRTCLLIGRKIEG